MQRVKQKDKKTERDLYVGVENEVEEMFTISVIQKY
jgi:hypothetical protein